MKTSKTLKLVLLTLNLILISCAIAVNPYQIDSNLGIAIDAEGHEISLNSDELNGRIVITFQELVELKKSCKEK